MLIRPDGYVALICDTGDMTTASDYFAAIGWVTAGSASSMTRATS